MSIIYKFKFLTFSKIIKKKKNHYRLKMRGNGVYMDPRLLNNDDDDDNDDRYSRKKHRHRKSHHHHKNEDQSIWDVWTVMPLSLAFCLIVLSTILILKKSHPRPFYSYDEAFKKCIPCPRDGICSKGKIGCKKGYVVSGKSCIADTEAELKAIRLAEKIGKYVASKPNQYCNESIGVTYEEILTNFRNELYFNEAIDHIEHTVYDVHPINNLYVSYNPVLDVKCKAYVFASKNKESLILFGMSFVLILILAISIDSKIKTRKLINETVEEIIQELKKKKGKKILVDEFEPAKADDIFKHWDEIVEKVEDNEAVEVFVTKEEKYWRYSP